LSEARAQLEAHPPPKEDVETVCKTIARLVNRYEAIGASDDASTWRLKLVALAATTRPSLPTPLTRASSKDGIAPKVARN
jgi:hypothetical protein